MRAARILALGLCALAGAARADAREAPPRDPRHAALRSRLVERLSRLVAELEGSSAYVIRDLAGDDLFERNGDAIYPAASTIKLPILLDLFKRAEEGSIDLSRPVRIDPAARVEGGGVLEKWSEPYPVLSADQLAVLMMDFSDNYATNLLIDLVGMETIQARLRTWGLKKTLLRRRMMDFEAARAGRDNVATPREMVFLLSRVYRGEILNPADTRRAIDIMTRNEGTPIKKGLPPSARAADKEGELDGVRCDSGIVLVPGDPGGASEGSSGSMRPFALSVMTARLKDEAAGEAFIRDVAAAACDYFAREGLRRSRGAQRERRAPTISGFK
jgi:beta-lactamase class A